MIIIRWTYRRPFFYSPASFVANDPSSMRPHLIICYPFNSWLYFLLAVLLEYEPSDSQVGLLETKTNCINVTQGFYGCKTKVCLRRTRRCTINNECWHKKFSAEPDDLDSNIYCHKPNIILPSAFSALSCRYNWRFYSHELLHTQAANATYGNDGQ